MLIHNTYLLGWFSFLLWIDEFRFHKMCYVYGCHHMNGTSPQWIQSSRSLVRLQDLHAGVVLNFDGWLWIVVLVSRYSMMCTYAAVIVQMSVLLRMYAAWLNVCLSVYRQKNHFKDVCPPHKIHLMFWQNRAFDMLGNVEIQFIFSYKLSFV